MVADQMGVQFDVGTRVPHDREAHSHARPGRLTSIPGWSFKKEPIAAGGKCLKIKVIPLAEMAKLYRTGKLDQRIGDTAVAAE